MNTAGMMEILRDRELRASKQKSLLKEGGCLVSFSLNIPGPVKLSRLYEIAFDEGIDRIDESIRKCGYKVLGQERLATAAGYVYFVRLDTSDIIPVKRAMIGIEERDSLGRLFDIDVLMGYSGAGLDGSASGIEIPPVPPAKISRRDLGMGERGCLICSGPVFTCLRTAHHRVPEVLMRVVDILLETPAVTCKIIPEPLDSFTGRTAAEALRAILYEVITTPKPGLVDADNNGAHDDMDITTFFDSAAAIGGYFAECVNAGISLKNEAPEAVLPYIRPLGIEAEKRMYEATGGINTHKGAVFSFGVICTAMGMLSDKAPTVDDILVLSGRICSSMPAASRGIREEVMAGYPSVRIISHPFMTGELMRSGIYQVSECRRNIEFGRLFNEAGVKTLIRLLSVVDDSNIVRRCGEKTARYVRFAAGNLCSMEGDDPEGYMKAVRELDLELIKGRTSPGGCADLLAITYFMIFSVT